MKQDQNKPPEATEKLPVLDSNRCGGQWWGGLRLDWILSPASHLRWGSGAEWKTHSVGFVQLILLSHDWHQGRRTERAGGPLRGYRATCRMANLGPLSALGVGLSPADQRWFVTQVLFKTESERNQDVSVLVLSPSQSSEFEFKPRVLQQTPSLPRFRADRLLNGFIPDRSPQTRSFSL